MNLYAYAGSDPINRVDPLGFSDCPPNVPPENCVTSTATRLPWDPSISGFDYHDIWALDDYEDTLSDPRNRPPVQARNPQTNNCGADGEQRFPNAFGGKSFDIACQTHDLCFATPGADFTACNKTFRRDIYDTLKSKSNWAERIVLRPYYKTTANAYFLGVQLGGRDAFRIAQYEVTVHYNPTPALGNMFTHSRIFGH